MSKRLVIQNIETLIGKKTEGSSIITHTLILEGVYKILFNHKCKGGNMIIYRNQHNNLFEIEFNYGKHKDRVKLLPSYLQTPNDVIFVVNEFIELFENYYDKKNRNR
jgi:uncharacterized protein YozE (UPF0346 family)